MTIKVGNKFWFPCEVKPGAFSDEPMVRVRSDLFDWVGFVPIVALKDPVTNGRTFIRALITGVEGDSFTFRLPGHALTSPFVEGSLSRMNDSWLSQSLT